MNMGTFEAMDQKEMMEVNGGMISPWKIALVGGYVDYLVIKHLYTLGYENGYNSTRK